ncbi:cation:proton antiporter [Candidatus Peregrinibacteria bacterium]|nr:MAG: cation:proton antiporter [Candidatus Peregrinibacteria bacterium]
MTDLFAITFALLFAFIASEIAKKLKFPRVIGQLCFSLLLALPFFKGALFGEDFQRTIELFSTLGIVFLMFLTGLEMNTEELKKGKKDAATIAFTAAVFPFFCGLLLSRFFAMSWTTGMVLGACLSVTAEGTTLIVLSELRKTKTYLASMIIGAGILDDVFEIFFLLLILGMTHSGGSEEMVSPLVFPIKLILFIVVSIAAFRFFPWIMKRIQKSHNEVTLFHGMLVIGLLSAMFAEFMGVGAIIGAFLAGIILQKSFDSDTWKKREEHSLHLLLFSFIIPFFFIFIGLHFEYKVLFENPILTLSVLFIAFFGKVVGVLIAKPFVSLTWNQLHLVGWGMNSRGVTELVIAHIALKGGLISEELYSAIVFMTVVTTVSFPFVVRKIVRRYPNIMDDASGGFIEKYVPKMISGGKTH